VATAVFVFTMAAAFGQAEAEFLYETRNGAITIVLLLVKN
jgi:hypothetical protein